MFLYLAAGLLAVFIGLALFLYVQTRNVEVARYETVNREGEFELRDYPSLIAAEVVRSGSRDQAVRAGFRPLASYIVASERPGEKIAMTAPVTQTEANGSWVIRFIMPSNYSLERLPKPAGSDVTLQVLPPARRAAVRFSGWWSDELFKEKDAALRAWMSAKGLTPQGPPILAYYNDPFTPGFLRRNEVLYDVAGQ